MLHILELLDREAPSGNAIFLFEVATGKVLGGNGEANDLFSKKHNDFDLKKIFADTLPLESLVRTMTNRLDTMKVNSVNDVKATTVDGITHPCSVDFTYLTDDRKGLLMIVKIKEDLRPIFMEMLLANSKRPAFLLDYSEGFGISNANEVFYQGFVCNRDNIQAKYGSKLENLLSEEDRAEYVTVLEDGISQNSSGILNVPFRTARGDNLLFYFSKTVIKPLIDEGDKILFCLLVAVGETKEDVEYPYDVIHQKQ